MVKFIKRTTLSGEEKDPGTRLTRCPFGDWVYGRDWIKAGMPILFSYYDSSGKVMKSSTIQDVIIDKETVPGRPDALFKSCVLKYKITTMNSIYYFEEQVTGRASLC